MSVSQLWSQICNIADGCMCVTNIRLFLTGNYEAMLNYSHVLERWRDLRENRAASELNLTVKNHQKPTEKIIQEFFTQVE